MATVTVLTAARMTAIEQTAVVGGSVQGDNLILTRKNGTTFSAGSVRGNPGDPGQPGDPGPPGVRPDYLPSQRYFTSLYYAPPGGRSSYLTVVGRMTLIPFQVTEPMNIGSVGINVLTAVAASTVRLGLYADTGQGFPGARITEFGVVNSATAGVTPIVLGTPLALAPGLYWLAAVAQGAAPTVTGQAANAPTTIGPGTLTMTEMLSSTSVPSGYYMAGVTGALPAAFSSSGTLSTPILVAFRSM